MAHFNINGERWELSFSTNNYKEAKKQARLFRKGGDYYAMVYRKKRLNMSGKPLLYHVMYKRKFAFGTGVRLKRTRRK